MPLLKLDGDLHPFLKADGPDAKHAPDIDQAKSPDLHKVLYEVGPRADEYALPLPRHIHDIVRHQAVPPFNEVERDLALADPRASGKKHADAVDVDKRAMNDHLGRELVVKKIGQEIGDLRCLELGPENRDVPGSSSLKEFLGDDVAVGQDDARHLEFEQVGARRHPLGRLQGVQVPDLRIAHDLDPVIGEQLDIPRQGQAGPVQTLVPDQVVKARLAVQLLQSEPIMRLLVQKAGGDAFFPCLVCAFDFHGSAPASPGRTRRRPVSRSAMRSGGNE